jgi:hypothetical protein
VEDGLTGFLRSQEGTKLFADAATASQRAVDLALIQYRDGAVDYQRVLDTQRTLLGNQQNLAQSQGNISTNLVATYKALGGGWELRENKDFVSEANKAQMRARTDWGGLLKPEETPVALDPPPPAKDLPLFPKPDW